MDEGLPAVFIDKSTENPSTSIQELKERSWSCSTTWPVSDAKPDNAAENYLNVVPSREKLHRCEIYASHE